MELTKKGLPAKKRGRPETHDPRHPESIPTMWTDAEKEKIVYAFMDIKEKAKREGWKVRQADIIREALVFAVGLNTDKFIKHLKAAMK